MNQILKRTTKILSTIAAILFLLILTVLVLSQTGFVRRFVLSQITSVIEGSTNGTMRVGSIEGNLLSGFVLKDVHLKLKTGSAFDSTDLVSAQELIARYSLFRYLRQDEIGVTSLELVRPHIVLVKLQGDSLWNYERLMKPSTSDSAHTPFLQVIDLQSLSIVDGTLIRRDYNSPDTVETVSSSIPASLKSVSWRNLDIRKLDLDAHLFIRGEKSQSLRVDHLSLTEYKSGFHIHHLEFSAYHDGLQTRLDQLHLVTDRSDLRLAIDAAPFAPLEGRPFSDMGDAESHLSIDGPFISTDELRSLLPGLTALAGSPGLKIAASGQLRNLRLHQLELDLHGRGLVRATGFIRNLHNPDSLSLDVNLTANDLSSQSLRSYIPVVDAATLEGLGTVTIRSLHFLGEPLRFGSTYEILSSNGNIKGSLALDVRQKAELYNVDVTTEHLDLAGPLRKQSLKSDLNVELKLKGSGFNWRTLTTSIALVSKEHSTIAGYDVTHLDIAARAQNGSLSTNRFQVSAAGGPNIALESARYDYGRSPAHYAATGTVLNLPLAKYVGSLRKSGAHLGVRFDMQGVGADPDQLTGNATATLSGLTLEGERINDVVAELSLIRAGPDTGTVFDMKSGIADVHFAGKFGVDDLVEVIPSRLLLIDSALRNRYFPNTVQFDSADRLPQIGASCDSIDLTFNIVAKDLRPITALIPSMILVANGKVSGSVTGCVENQLNLHAQGDFTSFVMRSRRARSDSAQILTVDSTTTDSTVIASAASDSIRIPAATTTILPSTSGLPRIQLTPITFNLDLDHLGPDPKRLLSDLDAHISLRADSVVRLNNLSLFDPRVTLDYRDREMHYNVAAVFAEKYRARLVGSAEFPRNAFVFSIDTLHFILARGYRWTNERPTRLTIEESGLITLDTLSLMRPQPGDLSGSFTEHIRMGGIFKTDTIRNAWVSVPNLRLKELSSVIPVSLPGQGTSQFEGIVQQLDLNVTGPFEHPKFAADLKIDRLKYGGLAFDSCYAHLAYDDETLRGKAVLHVDSLQYVSSNASDPHAASTFSSRNRLDLTIDSIPLLIALAHGPAFAQDSAAILLRPLSARLETYRFPIDIAAAFLPGIDELSGFGDIMLSLRGTQEHMLFGGAAQITNGTFRVISTNLFYTLDGKLSFAKDLLTLDGLQLRNVPFDDPSGFATLSGGIRFKGFNLDEFNIAVSTSRLKVLSSASSSKLRSVLGELTISTVGQSIQLTGSPNSPLLSGTLGIVESHLTIPQVQSTYTAANEGIIYRKYVPAIKPQTEEELRALRDSMRIALGDSTQDSLYSRLFSAEDDAESRDRDSVRLAQNIASGVEGPSFMDRLRYRINLNILGDAWIIVTPNRFNGLLGEQLRAELKTQGPFLITRGSDHQYHISGKLVVTDNSSYSFYKTFSPATGTITFLDDPSNPELDISAEYVGPHGGKSDQQVKIRLLITGTESSPRITMEIYLKNGAGADFVKREGSSSDNQEDVLYYLITGSFKNELDASAQLGAIQTAGATLPTQVATSMLNNLFASSELKNLIRSLNFEYGGNIGMSRLKLTAGYRDLTFRYGSSQLGNPLYSDYSIEVPLSFFFNFEEAKSILLDLDYHPAQLDTYEALQQPNVLGKVLINIPIH